jgi:antitoxin MazE
METGERRDVSMEKAEPKSHPREGWEDAFVAMAARGDDRLLDEETPTDWDETEWEW